PFREDRVGVLPVQHLALFGDAERSSECTRRLRDNRAVSWSAAAADGASTSVEEAQLHIASARDLMKRAVGLEDLPGTAEHATAFIGVRVSQHDLLIAAPGIEQTLVFRSHPELAADLRAGAKIVNGFEQRDWHDAWIIGIAAGRRSDFDPT